MSIVKTLVATAMLALAAPANAVTFWLVEPTENVDGSPINGDLEFFVINCQGLDNPGSFNLYGIPPTWLGKVSYTLPESIPYFTGKYSCVAYAVDFAGQFSDPSVPLAIDLQGRTRAPTDPLSRAGDVRPAQLDRIIAE